jgi:hypothetical protein
MPLGLCQEFSKFMRTGSTLEPSTLNDWLKIWRPRLPGLLHARGNLSEPYLAHPHAVGPPPDATASVPPLPLPLQGTSLPPIGSHLGASGSACRACGIGSHPTSGLGL